jgi:hypothetical protein
MILDPETTLAEAWEKLKTELHEGTSCPLCKGYAKIYHQPLNREMALFALALARWHSRYPNQFAESAVLLRNFRFSAGSYGRLRFWGAAEQGDGEATWRITELGWKWVWRSVQLPRYVPLLMNEPLSEPTPYTAKGRLMPLVSWDAALGNAPFDRDAFMRGEA